MKHSLIALLLTLLPSVAFAGETIQTFTGRLTGFIGFVLIDFLLALALLFFIWNAFRYFIVGGANEQDREKAKKLTIYSIAAFVFIIIVYAIVNMFVDGLGFDETDPLDPDFQAGYRAGPSIDS